MHVFVVRCACVCSEVRTVMCAVVGDEYDGVAFLQHSEFYAIFDSVRAWPRVC